MANLNRLKKEFKEMTDNDHLTRREPKHSKTEKKGLTATEEAELEKAFKDLEKSQMTPVKVPSNLVREITKKEDTKEEEELNDFFNNDTAKGLIHHKKIHHKKPHHKKSHHKKTYRKKH